MAGKQLISPVLADLSQDIAGNIPVDLILLWNSGKKDSISQKKLLASYTKEGIVVSSDASGLSKLTKERSLTDVMHLVSEPKEIIYSFGKAIGGEAIGIWVADNTQMFYPKKISPFDILEQMVAAQQEIKKLAVQVGIGMHSGEFLEIGGGLYGTNADHVEHTTENVIEAGDIVLTPQIAKLLPKKEHKWLVAFYENWYRIDYATMEPEVKRSLDRHYPAPFSEEFFEMIIRWNEVDESDRQKVVSRFLKEQIVVLVKIKHQKQKLLLDTLTERVVANAHIRRIVSQTGLKTVKSNGELGIFVDSGPNTAISGSQSVFNELRKLGFTLNIALARGEILLFPLKNGETEIAGGAVNLTSKLAEDTDEWNQILIEETVGIKPAGFSQFSKIISGVKVNGVCRK